MAKDERNIYTIQNDAGKGEVKIADEVVAKLDKNPLFDRIESVKPGFINIILSGQAVADYVNEMTQAKQFGYENPEKPKTVIVDYGGAMRQNRFT